MVLVIPGRPVPCVRMTHKTKFYNAQAKRYLTYKEVVAWEAKALCMEPLEGWVEVKLKFYFNNNKLPDLDNLIKGVLDGCNKIIYRDDKQIVRIEAERLRGEIERAEVEFREVV